MNFAFHLVVALLFESVLVATANNPLTVKQAITLADIPAIDSMPVFYRTLKVFSSEVTITPQDDQYSLVKIPLHANLATPSSRGQVHIVRNSTRSFVQSLDGLLPANMKRSVLQSVYNKGTCADQDRKRTVFEPDTRVSFHSESYPYSIFGRVKAEDDSSAYICTGTLIGENLVLTASHCIPWDRLSQTYVSFTPMYYEGEAPFGTYYGNNVWTYYQHMDENITLSQTAFDYSIVEMEDKVGSSLGYAGVKEYKSSWNNGEYWFNVGYPSDCYDSERPVISVDGSFYDFGTYTFEGREGYALAHRVDSFTGNSGGSFYGFWEDETFVSVVAVASSSDKFDNYAAGGPALLDLIADVRRETGHSDE